MLTYREVHNGEGLLRRGKEISADTIVPSHISEISMGEPGQRDMAGQIEHGSPERRIWVSITDRRTRQSEGEGQNHFRRCQPKG